MADTLKSLGDLFPILHYRNTEEILKDLNNHFKTVSLEKHYSAILSFTEEEAIKKVLRNTHGKVGKRAENRVRDAFIAKLRSHYGSWINIYDFKSGRYSTNFDCTYKTTFGRLYGYQPRSIFDHVFYTTHCFEQFDARTEDYPFGLIELAFRNVRNTTPTKADILRFLILTAFQYCETDNSLYFNIGIGIVVFDKLFPGILIAKTFLLPDMTYPQVGWRETNIGSFILDQTSMGNEYRKTHEDAVPIRELEFYDPAHAPYADIERFMKIRYESVAAIP
jgi:hypothetical protein